MCPHKTRALYGHYTGTGTFQPALTGTSYCYAYHGRSVAISSFGLILASIMSACILPAAHALLLLYKATMTTLLLPLVLQFLYFRLFPQTLAKGERVPSCSRNLCCFLCIVTAVNFFAFVLFFVSFFFYVCIFYTSKYCSFLFQRFFFSGNEIVGGGRDGYPQADHERVDHPLLRADEVLLRLEGNFCRTPASTASHRPSWEHGLGGSSLELGQYSLN